MKKITFLLVFITMTSFFAHSETKNFNKSEVNSETYVITLLAEPAEYGEVFGEGEFEYGKIITVEAIPNPGYIFLYWKTNGVLVSNSNSFTFVVLEDRTLTAVFSGNNGNNYNITVLAAPYEGGTVSGSGTYAYGEVVTISAEPAFSYEFVNWTVNGENYASDLSFELTVTENMTLVANFEYYWHFFTVTVLSNPEDCAVAGGGNNFLYGDWCAVYALGCDEYVFENWTEDGEEVYSEWVWMFEVTGDRVLVANFKPAKSTLGIDALETSSIEIYPNPTSGELRINSNELQVTGIEVFDIYGRNLTPHTAYLTPNTVLDISHLNSGIYFVKVFTEQGVVVKKVVKD